ncbi:MAG: biopolymer transporter ExbD [Rickettsiales bacterium]|nr:biopolymer transporter ExbD [Rickettsiales bacterium]
MNNIMYNFLNPRSLRHKNKIKSEINVTPFVDVMLVLLIIFMLTSHIINTGADIELPKSSENFSKKDDYLNISLDKHSNIYIQEIKIEKVDLIDKIKSILNEKPQIQIMIYGDQSTHYGDMIYVFSALRQASIDNVTLVTEE